MSEIVNVSNLWLVLWVAPWLFSLATELSLDFFCRIFIKRGDFFFVGPSRYSRFFWPYRSFCLHSIASCLYWTRCWSCLLCPFRHATINLPNQLQFQLAFCIVVCLHYWFTTFYNPATSKIWTNFLHFEGGCCVQRRSTSWYNSNYRYFSVSLGALNSPFLL